MNKLLLALLSYLLFPVGVNAQQNMVVDGNFEAHTNCSGGISNVTGCTVHWNNFNINTSADYFNTCCGSLLFDYQVPASGNGFMGVIAYQPPGSWKETIRGKMTPMTVGISYKVSMSINMSSLSRYKSDNIDVFFYQNGDSAAPSAYVYSVVPQVRFDHYGAIADTQNWVRIVDTFTADSAYNNIALGAFSYNVTGTQVSTTGMLGYYFIDSVVVWPLYPNIIVSDSALCAGDSMNIFYDVHFGRTYNPNNSFTLQLSDKTGNFNTPTNIASITSDTSATMTGPLPDTLANGTNYRIRIISSSPQDTLYSLITFNIINPDSSSITIGSNSPICSGEDLMLYAYTIISPTQYFWSGPGNYTSSLGFSTISNSTTSNTGNYYITMQLSGCEVIDTIAVTIKPVPANLATVANSPLCAGDSLHLSVSSSTSGISYSWVGPGSFSSSAQDTSIANSTTAMSGDYIVTANLNGCNRKDTTTVLVKPLPATVTLSNNTPICAGDTLHLSTTASTTGVSYGWTGPGSFSAATQNTNRVNTTAGMTGWYKMLVGLNGCTYMDSTYATIHPIPAVPNISYTNPLCIGETLTLGTSTVSGATYSWSGPGNYAATVQNPARTNMQFGDTGSYNLHITVNGCSSDTADASVHINPLPFVVIFPTPGDSICVGDRVNFTALPNNHGGTPAYQWHVNGQAAGAGTVFSTTTLSHQDVVRCDMTENTKCNAPFTDPSNDITMNVLTWLAPSVSISANPNKPLKENEYVTFTATATNAGNSPQYQWKRNGQDIVGATGAVWSANTLSDNDNITVAIVSNYKCPQPTSAISNTIVVKVLTGVARLNEIDGLVLYPNPNNGKFVLSGKLNTGEIVKLEVINAVGRVVFEDITETENGNLYHEIALPCAPPGIYMLRIKAIERLAVFKVLVR